MELAQASGAIGRDLRILVDDGARNAPLLGLVADQLGCDILVTPLGATLRGPAGAARDEAVEVMPVDRASGNVVDWMLIQPSALRTSLPGWFDLVGGLVLNRTGVVTLPLPDGLEFANREDFVVRRAAAARLGVGHPELVTAALASRSGGFLLSVYDADTTGPSQTVRGGRDVAAALSSIDLYGGDLRLWLRWPDDPAEQPKLDEQLQELALATGASIWTPAPGGMAVLLKGCLDLGVRDRDGRGDQWREYRPPGMTESARFVSDRDGRLVPQGGPVTETAGEVRLISVDRTRENALRDRYAQLSSEPGMFLLDLTVLEDGRLALRYTDDSYLAVGPTEFRGHLDRAGWQGEDLMLLTQVAPERAAGLREHLTVLADELNVEIWTLTPGSTVMPQDGLARAVDEHHRPARWARIAPGDEKPRWRNDDGWLIPRRPDAPTLLPVPTPPAVPTTSLPPPDTTVLPPASPRPALVSPARNTRPHGVRWLPERPGVNAEPIRLWIISEWSPQRVAAEGAPAADLFLLGILDGERLARSHPLRHLICLRVEAGGAVDLSQADVDIPADLRHLVTSSETFLLPAGWLDQARLQAGYLVDEAGHPQQYAELPGTPLTLRCTGARHGTDGLPNEVVRWPRTARGARAWAVIPESPAALDGDYLTLHQRRPPVVPGQRLVQLHVGTNRAIDVAASAAGLAGFTSVRSRLPELLANGVSMLLPRRSFERTTVNRVLFADEGTWRERAKHIDLPLSSLIEPGRR
ncbi:hypothetical protein GCM10027280_35420 [Micromonospora polyrhachis]|uniref:Uncharacterized protein n=1 Tax=Micromonospora polyrhachis TaxID=1282883 RepID=A0A7W7SQ18_9ACTN|nr:hypothetical protein [Micromonospora polyrhachis]MBB4958855.1 hypothetical protein [Micromonospora polyrhachis]